MSESIVTSRAIWAGIQSAISAGLLPASSVCITAEADDCVVVQVEFHLTGDALARITDIARAAGKPGIYDPM